MKKIVSILTILVIALIAMVGSVNAASINVQPSNVQKVNEGQEVLVTVSFPETRGPLFTLTYDKNNFEYVSADALSVNHETPGKLVIGTVASEPLTSLTVKFKALKTIDATQEFSVTDIDLGGTPDADATGSLVITTTPPSEGETTQPTPSEPTTSEGSETTTPSEKTNEGEEIVGTNGETIKELPQAGVPVFIGIISAIAIVAVVLAVRRIRK